jgi:menaquinol-cytochrome c reductase iron-sulfur subunit
MSDHLESAAVESDVQAAAETPTERPRRNFMVEFFAGALGAALGVVPLFAGLAVFLDPLRRKKAQGGKPIRVASLEAVPPDGQPHRFPVIDVRQDAWSTYPPQPIGAVYLRRESEGEPPKAYSAICPHLGCSVGFKEDRQQYQCPCHNSTWTIDAERLDPAHCPAPRDLDELKVEIRNDNEIWVMYQRFRSGISAKIPE